MDDTVLKIESISFGYSDKLVLEECSAELCKNEITALLGVNGEGKTTLIKCLLNQLKLQKGDIKLFGKRLNAYTVHELSKKISYVQQSNTVICDVIARDYIVEGRTPYLGAFSSPKLADYKKAEEYAEMLGITGLLGCNLRHLSGGQLQLVMIARALVQETSIVIMDEPMAALDLAHQVKLMKVFEKINKMGKTILFTTHNPNHALSLDCNVWILKDKVISTSGRTKDVLSESVLKMLYGEEILLVEKNEIKSCVFKPFK